MHKIISIFILIASIIPSLLWGQDKIVEVTGHVQYKGSDESVPGITVEVVGKEMGVMTNYEGNFTIVIDKGDKLKFTGLGFKDAYYVIPENYENKYLTLTQELNVDTVYLNEVLVKNLMNPEQFKYAFKYDYVPDEMLENIRRNTGSNAQAILINSLARSGAESQKLQQMNHSMKYGTEIGQNYIGTYGSLRAWREFYNAWKNGDFRSKKKDK